jgi:hypothetical protein
MGFFWEHGERKNSKKIQIFLRNQLWNHRKNNFENGLKPKTKIEGSFKG